MKTSNEINEIATALAAAQGEIENPTKNADNPFFKSKYADLAEVLGVVRPVFAKQQLSVVQMPYTARLHTSDATPLQPLAVSLKKT